MSTKDPTNKGSNTQNDCRGLLQTTKTGIVVVDGTQNDCRGLLKKNTKTRSVVVAGTQNDCKGLYRKVAKQVEGSRVGSCTKPFLKPVLGGEALPSLRKKWGYPKIRTSLEWEHGVLRLRPLLLHTYYCHHTTAYFS